VKRPRGKAGGEDHSENEPFIVPDVSERLFQGEAEKISAGGDREGPGHGPESIENDERPAPYGTHSQDERGNRPEAVGESKKKNDGRPDPVEPAVDDGHPPPPGREEFQDPAAVPPAEKEKKLVAGIASQEGRQDDGEKSQVSLIGRKASHDQDHFPFEKGPDQDGPESVGCDEMFQG